MRFREWAGAHWPTAFFVAVKVLLYGILGERYDYNGDELYFIACGARADFGYVDHPPLVPWLARLTDLLFGSELHALRLPGALAGAGTMALTLAITRNLGGGSFALGLAGLSMLAAPVYLRMGTILCVPVVETFFWTLATYCTVRLVKDGCGAWWVGVGGAVGLGLLTKYSMVLWGLGTGVGLMLTSLRGHFGSRSLWLGAALAATLIAPNIAWQARYGWPSLEFLRNIGRDQLEGIPRSLFLLGQVLYLHPVALPIWIAGLWRLLFGAGKAYKILAITFVTVLLAFLATHAKPYYLAPAYPPLIAAGAAQIAEWSGRLEARARVTCRLITLVTLALGALVLAPLSLPVLSLEATDLWISRLVGISGVASSDLTFEFHHEYGWREQVAGIEGAYRSLSPDERASCVVMAHTYAQASAINFFGNPTEGLPRAISGHMTYYLWGPGHADPTVVIAIGMKRKVLRDLFAEVTAVAEVTHPLAVSAERDLTIHICRQPLRPLRQAWPEQKRFRFRDP
ncbi:MAG: glycosyltransferase family 39 protein [Candidatus Eisenbacteria bacterium]